MSLFPAGKIMFLRTNVHKLSLILISVVTAFLVAETALRLFKPQIYYIDVPDGWNLPERDACHVLAPNLKSYYETNEFRVGVSFNSDGLRDREFADKDKDTYRILVIGDSFTWGSGAAQDETYPKHLERLLINAGIKAEVINAGIPGYDTRQEYFYFLKYGLSFKPDMVIIGFFPNDITGVDSCVRTVNQQGNLVDYAYKDFMVQKKQLFRIPNPFSLKLFLVMNSHVYQLIVKTVQKLKGLDERGLLLPREPFLKEEYMSPYILNAYDIAIKYLEKIKILCEDNKIRFVLLAIPMKEQMGRDDLLGEKYNLKRPQKILEAWAERNAVSFIDPIDKFREESKKKALYWTDDSHMNKDGYSVLAGEICDRLISTHLLKAR